METIIADEVEGLPHGWWRPILLSFLLTIALILAKEWI